MKILRIQLCIIFVSICSKNDKFSCHSLKNRGTCACKKFSYLDPSHSIKNTRWADHKTVYSNELDSLSKRQGLQSYYTDYVRDNQTVELPLEKVPSKNILSIETSFDNTCAAVVRSNGKILSEKVLSQENIIQKYGGIKPYSSKQAHENNIEPVTLKVIKESGLKLEDIDEIAVTRGPGTELCLRVGYNYALELSKRLKIPLVPENHIAAHCLSPFISGQQVKFVSNTKKSRSKELKYPYLCLLLSGAHSQIYVVESPSSFHLMCDTQDEYAGNVLDKCARDLGLDVSKGGGPELERASEKVKFSRFNFNIPDTTSRFLEFCFSGIQTQLKYKLKSILKEMNRKRVRDLPNKIINELAYTTQKAVFTKIVQQLERAIEVCQTFFPISNLVVVGGVAANKKLNAMIFDMLYQRDDSTLFLNQYQLIEKLFVSIRRTLKDKKFEFSEDNPYTKKFEEFKDKIKTVKDLVHYLWNPELIPDLLIPGSLEKVSTVHKNELYKGMIDIYLSILGKKLVSKLEGNFKKMISLGKIVQPSEKVLEMIKTDKRSPCILISGGYSSNRWEMFSTAKRYTGDNAVMIGFSLIEKHRMGISKIENLEKIEGKDVLPRWNLGKRKNWELLSDICKIDSALKI